MPLKFVFALAISVSAWAAQAACPAIPGRFVANGAEVTDTQTGLVWARCSVGQTWSGSGCTGSATLAYHQQALTLANNVSGWRLPNVKELASLVDRRCESPAIDSAAFPNMSSFSFWSSTIESASVDNAQSVDFTGGRVSPAKRNGDYVPVVHGSGGYNQPPSIAVRLVRASQ